MISEIGERIFTCFTGDPVVRLKS